MGLDAGRILGTSGQGVDDIFRFTTTLDRCVVFVPSVQWIGPRFGMVGVV